MKRLPQPGRFALVGAVATAVHLIVASTAIIAGLAPLWANPLAFSVAFAFSYSGHKGWTFAATDGAARWTLPRFFAVALAGLAVQQAALALFLAIGAPEIAALAVAVLGAAGLTYLLSRDWAFGSSSFRRGRSTCQR